MRDMRRHQRQTPRTPEIKKPTGVKKFALFIGRWLKRACITTGALALIVMLFGNIALYYSTEKQELPENFVLAIEISQPITETPAAPSLADPFAQPPPTLQELVNKIDLAASDDRVFALLFRIKNARISTAQANELRNAIERFKKSGKRTYIYASSWDGGIGAYYLASIFDEIWMQPMGALYIGGVRAEMPFFKDLLDKLGVEAQMLQRKEYKSAYESLTRSDMSPKARESLQSLIDDIAQTVVRDTSDDLDITKSRLKEMIDKGLFIASDALETGLITNLDYADVLVENIKTSMNEAGIEDTDAPFVDAQFYTQKENPHHDDKKKVAIINVDGTIMQRDKNSAMASGLMGDKVAAADEIARAILSVVDDTEYFAIVLRINSPGGSPVASETIARALEIAKQDDLKIVVSMGDVAASGGYWVATPADRIFANPTTITGSIGVIGGKIALKGLWQKAFVNWDGVQWGENADIWSSVEPFNESQLKAVGQMLDYIYDSFITRVAKGRNMSPQDVEKVAKGRVWSGSQALNRGLVDELGTLNDALDYVAVQLCEDDRFDLEVDILPKPLTPVERIISLIEGGTKASAIQNELLKSLSPVISALTTNDFDGAVTSDVKVE